ncbi:MAG: L,D-transpeptidase family protein [Verrucomicrobiales bacterium]
MPALPRYLLATFSAALLVLPSCNTIPSAEKKQSAAWQLQHDTFRQGEKWKKDSFVNEEVVAKLTPENTTMRVQLWEQRGLLLHADNDIAIDFPISSGRRAFPTKPGSYKVIDKKLKHSSNLYGKYVELETGKVLNSDVDTTVDKMPENARYVGSSMPYFLRLTNTGLGLHVGIVPGYPASHGCVRVPGKIMPKVFSLVPKGTPVEIVKDNPSPATEEKPASKKKSGAQVARN